MIYFSEEVFFSFLMFVMAKLHVLVWLAPTGTLMLCCNLE
jgi:hypothetical protein